MKPLLYIYFLTLPFLGIGQANFKECYVVQTTVSKPEKKDTSLIQFFNNSGLVIHEKFSGHKISEHSRKTDGDYYYYSYLNQDLTKIIFVQKSIISSLDGFDTTRTELLFENQLKIKEITNEYETRPKENLGYDVLEYPADFQPKQWYFTGETFFTYDENNRLTEEYAHKVYCSSQNRYVYAYSDNGKLLKKRSFDHKTLIWTETHTYLSNKEIMIRIWESNEEIKEWSNPNYWKFISYFDSEGRLINKECFYNKLELTDVFHSSEEFEYDANGMRTKHIIYNEKMKPVVIHEYFYK